MTTTDETLEDLSRTIASSLINTELGDWLQAYKITDIAGEIALSIYRTHTKLLMDQLEYAQDHCPFDCDHCHGDGCPCNRMGCDGDDNG